MVEIPEDVSELLMRFKSKEKMSDEEMGRLLSHLSGLSKLYDLVTSEPYSYSLTDYKRLHKRMERKGLAVKPTEPDKALELVKTDKQREWVRRIADTMWEIGAETIMKWYSMASDLGYYNEEKKEVDMRSFVGDAIDFFLGKGRTVREVERENTALHAGVSLLAEAQRRLMQRLYLLRITLDMILRMNPEIETQLIPLDVQLQFMEGVPSE